MSLKEIGRTRGREAGAKVKGGLAGTMSTHEAFIRALFPTVDIDLRVAWRAYDQERLACEPDYTKLPEARGIIEQHLGEREGFREAAGCDEAAVAFHFSSDWFWTRRLNSQHVARWDLLSVSSGCTNVFIPDGVEGVTIGDNRDIPLMDDRYHFRDWHPWHLRLKAAEQVNWCQGSVSSGILLDEEPSCSFPLNPAEMLPDDCLDDINSIVEFMSRYSEFWGPCKQIWVDRKLRAIGVEKSTCRMGFLPADSATGAVAVTACSAVSPELKDYRDACFGRAAEIKGESRQENLDWRFVHGGDARQHRLTELAFAEARRGATLWGTLEVVADHAVPYPDRVCLAGEKTFPEKEPLSNWSVTQHAAVLTGPRRRTLYRTIEDMAEPRAVYDYPPKLELGAGVAMLPEWEAEVDSGQCLYSAGRAT